jgi:UDP-N-acetyl-D-galactosamine dehydrogenase
VLAAANTKWNFLSFYPGLVGGHCIGVDPYYLTHRAERAGYHPEVILAGRRINDGVGQRVAQECLRVLVRRKSVNPVVTILGLTFKENVPDIRNSRVIDIVQGLNSADISVQVHDCLADAEEARREYGIALVPLDRLAPADAVILAVAHDDYIKGGWSMVSGLLRGGDGLVMDIRWMLDRAAKPAGVELWRL